MAVDVLLGLQWGDEGKGKIVDVLTKKYDIIARFQGGEGGAMRAQSEREPVQGVRRGEHLPARSDKAPV